MKLEFVFGDLCHISGLYTKVTEEMEVTFTFKKNRMDLEKYFLKMFISF